MNTVLDKQSLIALFDNSQVAVAAAAGCSKQAVSAWKDQIPPLRALAIERSPEGRKRGIKAWQLRPDYFDPPEEAAPPKEAA